MTPGNRSSRWRRGLERALLVAGVAGATLWLVHTGMFTLGQSWDNWVFERQARGEEPDVRAYLSDLRDRIQGQVRSWLGLPGAQPEPLPQSSRGVVPPPPADNQLIGRLSIPRLQVRTTVREGTSENTLALATGHIRGTTLPGQNGNVGVAGHRDTFFQGLAGVRLNDLIEFETTDTLFGYEVISTEVVKPNAVDVLRPGRYPELTLVTCYPFHFVGSAPRRFIVKARQISQTPLQTRVAETQPPKPALPAPDPLLPTADPPLPAAEAPPPRRQERPDSGNIPFQISRDHSAQVAPGISIGVTGLDTADHRVDGWVWVMPDRRTLWLRDHRAREPLVFYQDGERRQLVIASVTPNGASGYLLLR